MDADASLVGPIDIIGWVFFSIVGVLTGGLIELLHGTVFSLYQANEALRTAEREKDLPLQESAHRARNDLARLAALIELEHRAGRCSSDQRAYGRRGRPDRE